jgi:RNA polymerase sigma factor (sigma-70 family)
MPSPSLRTLLRTVRYAAGSPVDQPGDGELLERFVGRQDEAAFAELLRRHGAWLYGLCRRLVPDFHTAEDVFQATVLVLIRRARTVRRQASVGSWLHGVVLRVAARARSQVGRWQDIDDCLTLSPAPDPADDAARCEAVRLLHEELARLPTRYREPILLCDLAGLSREAAAHRLGCGEGSIKGRLERGRAALRDRLVRRGLAVTAASFFVPEAAPPAVSAAMSESLLRASAALTLGFGAEGMSPSVVGLMEGMLHVSWANAWKGMAAVAVLGAAAAGIGWAGGAGPLTWPAKQVTPSGATAHPLAPAEPVPASDNGPAKAALREAERILENVSGDAMERGRLWCDIARFYAKFGDRDAAKSALVKAKAVMNANGWRYVGSGYAALGDAKDVLALAKEMPPPDPRLGNTLSPHDSFLQEPCITAAESGQAKAALAIADAMEDAESRAWFRSFALRRPILDRAKSGDMEGALRAANNLPSDLEKARALVGSVNFLDSDSGLALVQYEAGNLDGARRSVREALVLTASLPGGQPAYKVEHLIVAAIRALARINDLEAAQRKLPQLTLPDYRVKAVAYIAMAQVRNGHEKQALDAVDKLERAKDRIYLLHQIGSEQAKAGNKAGAKTSFRRAAALVFANEVGSGYQLVSAQVKAGDLDGAIEVATKLTTERTDLVNDQFWFNIASYQAKAADFVGAFETTTKRVKGRWSRGTCLGQIAKEQTRAGHEAVARFWIAREEDALNKAYALVGLADGLYREDDRAKKPAEK